MRITPLIGSVHMRNIGGQHFRQQQWTPHVWFNMLLDVLVWYLGETDLAGYVCINKSYIGGTKMRNKSVSEQAHNIFLFYVPGLFFVSKLSLYPVASASP